MKRFNLANFGPKFPILKNIANKTIHTTRRFPPTENVYMVKPRADNADAGRICLTCLTQCNSNDVTNAQIFAFYLSAICCLFPTMEDVSRKVLGDMGYYVTIQTEETWGEVAFELEEMAPMPNLQAMVGQVILIMYKNISPEGYDNFMTSKSNDMKSIVGVTGPLLGDDGGEVVIAIDKAVKIRVALGAQTKLRSEMLNAMLSIREGNEPVNRLCAYICDVLNWTEMSPLLFIFETLCLTNSPVLEELSVQHEIRNLYKAYYAVRKFEMPQYYRILKPFCECTILMREKFRMLATVAQHAKITCPKTASQFAAAKKDDDPEIYRLIQIHSAHMRRHEKAKNLDLSNFMTVAANMPELSDD